MKVREIVRIAVVKTNPYWPFSSLNKLPYYLAIKAFIQLCKRFPEIKSIYLRHGLTEQNWIPALSDIDLTLIIDSKLTIEEEFSFLSSFWKNYDGMKKLFPMLGEIEILNEEYIGSWTKFNIRGYESRNWKLIYGIETAKSNYAVNSTRLCIDSLNHALWVYLDFFLTRFCREEISSFMVVQEMQRLAFKILRYADYLYVHDVNQNLNGWGKDKTDMLCCVLEGLEKGIRRLVLGYDKLARNPRECEDDLVPRKVSFQDQALDTKELAPFHREIEGIFFAYATNVVVLKSGLDASAMKGCIDVVSRVFAKQGFTPIITNPCIFEYMLQFYNPFLYTDLLRSRKIACGKDLLPDIKAPGLHHFISKVLEQTATVITFPQSHAVISPPNPSWFSERQLDSILKRSLFIKMYLEKRVIKPSHNELLAECHSSYPDYYERLKEIKGLREEALNKGAFRLLRGITSDIHRSISTLDSVDNLLKIDEGDYRNK